MLPKDAIIPLKQRLMFCFVLFCFVLFCFDCLFVCLFVFGSYLLQFPFQIEKRKDFKRDAQKPVHVFHCFICNQNLQSVLFNFVPYTT